MRRRFGTPAVLGAAAFAAVTLHSGHPADDIAATARGTETVGDSDAASSGFGAGDALSGAHTPPVAAETPATTVDATAVASDFDIRSVEYDIPVPAVRPVGDFGSWPAVDRTAEPAGGSCAVTPFATLPPAPGIAAINGPGVVECTPSGIDTLRYSIPGPIRGADPGPPVQI
ncbi:hypothetical protein IU474_01255 [Nocardia otitidiscaviarum]|uniref:hypothetical protein n=1 Tax=Nocardia otitidiscaviarum TaxID=1823 RepID=UPI001892FA1B|nr:hypothetical protein [Nocardia otitidiscaviarum]MBF6235709.1 hypothetical protein [Nocardia otitidiscaviarum]